MHVKDLESKKKAQCLCLSPTENASPEETPRQCMLKILKVKKKLNACASLPQKMLPLKKHLVSNSNIRTSHFITMSLICTIYTKFKVDVWLTRS